MQISLMSSDKTVQLAIEMCKQYTASMEQLIIGLRVTVIWQGIDGCVCVGPTPATAGIEAT